MCVPRTEVLQGTQKVIHSEIRLFYKARARVDTYMNHMYGFACSEIYCYEELNKCIWKSEKSYKKENSSRCEENMILDLFRKEIEFENI